MSANTAALPSVVALIPARSGSKRVPLKNIRRLDNHPIIAYTIAPALESGIFSAVVVSTDSEEIAAIARHYGASVPFLRPAAMASDTSPDIEWVEHALKMLSAEGHGCDCFCLLRPTSPFRSAETIRRAWHEFASDPAVDSLRAVEKCRQHPGKMWVVRGKRMVPLLSYGPARQPWHSSQYQSLPVVYVQNASLEIAWARVVAEQRTIAGEALKPFFTEALEGYDINDPNDWLVAEHIVNTDPSVLPAVGTRPYRETGTSRA